MPLWIILIPGLKGKDLFNQFFSRLLSGSYTERTVWPKIFNIPFLFLHNVWRRLSVSGVAFHQHRALIISMALARPYLMTLYVIFLIHLNFPISQQSYHWKKKTMDCLTVAWESFFFFKKAVFMILYMHIVFDNFSILSRSVPIFHVSWSIIYLLFKYLEELIVFLIKRKVD